MSGPLLTSMTRGVDGSSPSVIGIARTEIPVATLSRRAASRASGRFHARIRAIVLSKNESSVSSPVCSERRSEPFLEFHRGFPTEALEPRAVERASLELTGAKRLPAWLERRPSCALEHIEQLEHRPFPFTTDVVRASPSLARDLKGGGDVRDVDVVARLEAVAVDSRPFLP